MIKNRMFNPMEVGKFSLADFFENTIKVSSSSLNKHSNQYISDGYIQCHFVSSDPYPSSTILVKLSELARQAFSKASKHELSCIEISRGGCVTFISRASESKRRYIAGRVCNHTLQSAIG